ncbi:MAG: hypothetical protein MUE85_03435 [Microscillaceae bacterium]|jgi:hypothetical protein|nr:hypothetical protein [Microscillaceae bacterium]
MHKFIFKTLLLASPILIIGLGLELMLRYIPNDYQYKKKYMDTESAQIETLILGSSHSFYGINPNYMSPHCFNASHISQSLEYDWEILKNYEPKFKNLKTIILPISYFTLFEKLEPDKDAWWLKNYLIYYGFFTSQSLKNYSEVLSNQLYINLYRINAYYLKGNSARYCNNLGWGTNYTSTNAQDLLATGKIAAWRHTQKNINQAKYKKIFADNCQLLRQIIQWTKVRKIQLLLLTPPAFETYRLHINQAQLKLTVQVAQESCNHNQHCTYINFLDSPQFVSEDFYDADHLSEIGAKKFSIILHNYLKNK